MSVTPRVRDQLILSRRLLMTPDDPSSGYSDPFLLTRDLIVCCGAAGLSLAAICVQLDCVPDKKSIGLMDYLDSLGKTSYSESAAQEIDYVAEFTRSSIEFAASFHSSRPPAMAASQGGDARTRHQVVSAISQLAPCRSRYRTIRIAHLASPFLGAV
jgi:hypothetical protein